jgi:hypothetical protein
MAPRKQPSTTVRARKASAPTKSTNGSKPRPAAAKPGNGRATAPETTRQAAVNNTRKPRLEKGQLEALVSDHLKAHPKGDYSPSELANVLGRSGGAIANALERLVRDGGATRTSDAPRRYRHRSAKPGGKASAKR